MEQSSTSTTSTTATAETGKRFPTRCESRTQEHAVVFVWRGCSDVAGGCTSAYAWFGGEAWELQCGWETGQCETKYDGRRRAAEWEREDAYGESWAWTEASICVSSSEYR